MKTIILIVSLTCGLWQGIEMLGSNIKAGIQADRVLKG